VVSGGGGDLREVGDGDDLVARLSWATSKSKLSLFSREFESTGRRLTLETANPASDDKRTTLTS
jgi:hypothetical protein